MDRSRKSYRKKLQSVRLLDQNADSSDSDQEVYSIGMVNASTSDRENCLVELPTNGINYKWKVDTGADVNIVPKRDMKILKILKQNIEQVKSTRITDYSGKTIDFIGKVKVVIKEQNIPVFIVSTNQPPIIGLKCLSC
jgi:hypothetical protein